MKKLLLILALVSIVSGASYYVSTTGSDDSSGTVSAPLLTVNAAIAKCQNTVYDTVILRGGIHATLSAISLDTADSNIVFRNYSGESPVISGGYFFTGDWVLYDTVNNIYERDIPSNVNNREMYIQSSGTTTRCTRARTRVSTWGTGWKTDSTGSYDSNTTITLVDTGRTEAVFPDWFYEDRALIDTVEVFNTTGTFIKYIDNAWFSIKSKYRATGRPYPTAMFLENDYSFIDSVSEWYVNKNTNKIYYKPRASESINSDTFVIAQAETLMVIQSTKNIKISGLNFRYGTWMRPSISGMAQGGGTSLYDSMLTNTDYSDIINFVYQMPSNINVSNSSGVTFTDCDFRFTGGGVVIGFDSTCREDTVTGCDFYRITGPAVAATPSYVSKYPTKISCTYNTAIFACDIYRGTRVFEMQHLDSSDISHNTVSNAPWCGIYIGENPKNTVCSYNKVDSTCWLFLDGGQIYACGTATNTTIHDNYMGLTKRDITANLFLDNGGGTYGNGFEIYNNIFDGMCKTMFWSGPYNNIVHDNYVAVTDTWISANPAYGNTFTNNDTVVYKWSPSAIAIINSTGAIPRTYSVSNTTWPQGTKYVIPIDVDTSIIRGSDSSFLYSKVIVTDAGAKANFTTKNNICVYDAVLGQNVKKTISYRTTDTLNIDWVAPINKATAHDRFYVCFGNQINVPDSAEMYASVNVIRRYTFDDTIIDRTGNSTGNTVDSISYWKFGDMRGIQLNLSGKFVTTTALPQSFNAEILAYYDKTLSVGGGMLMSSVTTTGTRIYFTSDFLQVYLYNNTGSTISPTSSLRDKTWHVVNVDKNVTTSNIFAEKDKIVTNGSVGNSTHGVFTIGSYASVNNSYKGYIDDITIRSTADPDSVYYTRYEMVRPTSIMLLAREGFSPELDPSGEMGIDTLTFTCSAEGAITYQWFLDGVEIPGETDSVLVIYADSAFYSTTHTLYCLVNGSIVSDSWTIREQTSNWFFFWRRR